MSFCLSLHVYTKYFFPWRNINPYFKKFEDDLLNEKKASVKEIAGRNTLETEETVRTFLKYYIKYHRFHILEVNLTH